MKFIGRKKELKLLEETIKRANALIKIDGRRRVGKSFLINHFLSQYEVVFKFIGQNDLSS